MNILITAGPTREYIDPVRFISNDSSGRMGFELAKAAEKAGLSVTLIAGPVDQKKPKGVKRIDVVSADEMFREVKKHHKTANIIIMSAAVADFRPARYSSRKIKKAISPSHHLTISLKKTPDILAWLGRNKMRGQIIMGFALETNSLVRNARSKLRKKNCDLIVANHARAIGNKKSSIVIIDKFGGLKKLPRQDKSSAASIIIKNAVARSVGRLSLF